MPIKATFTGDVTDLRRSTEQARQEFRKVGTEAEGAARQLKAVGSSFDGTKLEGAARKVAAGIERIGGASRLSDSELARSSRTISEVLQKYDRMGTEAPANIRALGAELDKLRQKSAALKDLGPPDAAAKSFGLLQGAVAGVAAAISSQALTAVKSFGADVVAMAGNISDLSAKTGLTTTQVQQFGYAAAQTGTSIDTVSTAVSQLSNKLVEGGTGTVSAVKSLGLELNALRQMDPGTAFTTIADAIAKVPDPMQQTQLAMELFGKAGVEMLPLIKAGLSETAAEASRLGLVINEESIKALDDMGDAWDRTALRAKVAAANMATHLQPLFEAINRILEVKPEDMGDAAAGALRRQGERMWSAAQQAYNDAPWQDKLTVALRQGPRQFLGRAFVGAASLLGDPNASPLPANPLAPTIPMDDPGKPAAARLPFAPSKEQIADVQKYREELDKLTGADMVADATRLARQLEQIGAANVLPTSLPTFVKQLQEGLDRARALGDDFAGSARQIEAALNHALNSPAYREFFQKSLRNPTIGVNRNLEDPGFARTGIAGATFPSFFVDAPGSTIPQRLQDVDVSRMRSSIAGITVDFQKGLPAIKNWNTELQKTAQAFAQLAQIAGPSLSGVTRGIGTAIASVDAATQLVSSLSGMFPGLQKRDANGNVVGMSGGGRALAGGLAGLSIGLQLGQFQTDSTEAFLSGAAGGAATGGLTGGWAGAGAGLVIGGFASLFAANQNRRQQQAAMEDMRQQVIDSFGTLEDFKAAVERAGTSYERFMELFNSDDPETFQKTVWSLNNALNAQSAAAGTLVKGLQEVARVQGVLSRGQLVQLGKIDPNGPGAAEAVAFAQQQRQQAEQGITTAIAAIDAATAGGTQNMAQFQASIGATTASLVVLFDTAVRNGESAITVLQRLADPIKQLQALITAGGQTPGAGFGALSVLTDIATGEQTGPLVALAQGLGQALAGFANTGLLSPELFGELANGIGEAYHQLELFGKGGLEAARLMQPSLQAIWQMIQDNPALRGTLDATTLALLDFAEQAGLIGEAFRPAIDRMIDGINELIERINAMIDALSGVPRNITTTITTEHKDEGGGGGGGGTGELDENDHVKLAAGGIVTRSTHALIGEAGPEAVIPLRRGLFSPTFTIVTPVLIDGYEAARAITRHQPAVYRTYGAA